MQVWTALAEAVTGSPKDSDTSFWKFVRRLDYAGINAVQIMDEAPTVKTILTEKESVSAELPEQRGMDAEELRKRGRRDPRWFMRAFQVVETPKVGVEGRVYIPFDLLDKNNPRSVYQELSYGKFLDRLSRGDNPVGSPHLEGRTKPRQVGSTEFHKQLAACMVQCYSGYRVLLHFPLEDDAKDHLREIANQLERMARLWPQYFYPIVRKSIEKGHLLLAHGSEILIRHAGGSGLTKLGGNFNAVILSEAGKYEKLGANVWSAINQVIVPAVHAGSHNYIVWEGTNDEQARELQRIAKLAEGKDSPYNFEFYPWTILSDYVGPSVVEAQDSPEGKYADYIMVDGERTNISEAAYSALYNLSPGQIGFRRLKLDALGDLDLFHREYPMTYEESCTAASSSFFGSNVILKKYDRPIFRFNFSDAFDQASHVTIRQLRYSVEPSSTGRWSVWHQFDASEEYVLAGDFSDGIPGGDYTVLSMHRLSDGTQVAGSRFRGGTRNEIIVAWEMACIVHFYKCKVYVIGELNNVGKAVRSRWIDYGHAKNYHRLLERKTYDEYTDSMWFLQSPATKGPAVLRFRTAIGDDKITMSDERFIWDARDFVKSETKSGNTTYGAVEQVSNLTGEKARDDYVIAAALAWEMLRTHPMRKKFHDERPGTPKRTRTLGNLVDDPEFTYNEMLSGRLEHLFGSR